MNRHAGTLQRLKEPGGRGVWWQWGCGVVLNKYLNKYIGCDIGGGVLAHE
jgi:hypothetical protein